ncbi:hypothetical protein CAPTEDRAFT_201925 [Capitella teleta]|uniref:Uncharacterized protein n=1 Tax=Capitella teleta TaxID=283909 RepID=R7TCZ5_CAPTE|nr:hypothetical protein CAPTEDRAFT_201925 [Capitella teleta]|eukprot:ELT91347.1 hypothetical protein CAPTEDRAFT_201925 [Capitella teleta]
MTTKSLHRQSMRMYAQPTSYEDGPTLVPKHDLHHHLGSHGSALASLQALCSAKFGQRPREEDQHPKDTRLPQNAPPMEPKPGLPHKRQEYLYKQIGPSVDEPYQDIVCPLPEHLQTSSLPPPPPPPPAKKSAPASRKRKRKN